MSVFPLCVTWCRPLPQSQVARLTELRSDGGGTHAQAPGHDPFGGALAAGAAAGAGGGSGVGGGGASPSAAAGRMDPCSLHWNAGLRSREGAGEAAGAAAGAGGGGGNGSQAAGAQAQQQRPLLYVGVLTRPTAKDKRDALRHVILPFPPLFAPIASFRTNPHRSQHLILRWAPHCRPCSSVCDTTHNRETWFRQGQGEWIGAFFLGRPKGDPALAAALEARGPASQPHCVVTQRGVQRCSGAGVGSGRAERCRAYCPAGAGGGGSGVRHRIRPGGGGLLFNSVQVRLRRQPLHTPSLQARAHAPHPPPHSLTPRRPAAPPPVAHAQRRSLAVLERGSLQARAEFVLKTDDDSYVYMRQLLRELRAAPRAGYFWGYNIGVFKPIRDKKARALEAGAWGLLCVFFFAQRLGKASPGSEIPLSLPSLLPCAEPVVPPV